MAEVRSNFIVEILTPTPRRLTSFRGRTSDGQRGLIVGGAYYKASILELPGIEESDTTSPVRMTLSLGNANNTLSDLYSNSANFRAPITIQRVTFTGTWDAAFPPTVTAEPWFAGFTGTPALNGERLLIECHADLGRRGSCPATKSRSILVNHAPLHSGQKLSIRVRTV